MKVMFWLCLMQLGVQIIDMGEIRNLYQRAPKVKKDALQLNQLMLRVDSLDAPVLICYKGANEMIQAKYTLNPFAKFEKFNRGKELIKKAFSRDSLNLEMRFIRYSIQINLPSFLGYNDELDMDKRFLLDNTRENKDTKLKEIIFNYLAILPVIKQEELKQLKK